MDSAHPFSSPRWGGDPLTIGGDEAKCNGLFHPPEPPGSRAPRTQPDVYSMDSETTFLENNRTDTTRSFTETLTKGVFHESPFDLGC